MVDQATAALDVAFIMQWPDQGWLYFVQLGIYTVGALAAMMVFFRAEPESGLTAVDSKMKHNTAFRFTTPFCSRAVIAGWFLQDWRPGDGLGWVCSVACNALRPRESLVGSGRLVRITLCSSWISGSTTALTVM